MIIGSLLLIIDVQTDYVGQDYISTNKIRPYNVTGMRGEIGSQGMFQCLNRKMVVKQIKKEPKPLLP